MNMGWLVMAWGWVDNIFGRKISIYEDLEVLGKEFSWSVVCEVSRGKENKIGAYRGI